MKFFLQKKLNKKAFTLVELIVAIFISSILFLFLFNFVVDALNEMKASKNKSQVFSNFSSLDIKLKNISKTFSKYSLLINNTSWSWNDIILFKNIKWNKGVAFWVIDRDKMRFSNTYNVYWEYVLGFVELSSQQLNDLSSNPNKIYDYPVYLDNVFDNIFVRDFQVKIYNVDKILDITMIMMDYYNPSFDWDRWEEVPRKWFFKLILNF